MKARLIAFVGVLTGGMLAFAASPEPAFASGPWICGCGGTALAAGVDASGIDYVFYGGADNGLWEKWSSDSTYWSSTSTQGRELLKPPIWDSAGDGDVVNTPAVAVHANGEQDVFWQGENGDLYEYSYVPSSGGWQPLKNLGGPGPNNYGFGGLTAGADANGNDYLFWNNDGSLLEKWHIGSTWYGPSAILSPPAPGLLGTPVAWWLEYGPTVAVHANSEQDVFWQGYNEDLWESYYPSGTGWLNPPKDLKVQPTFPANVWPTAGADSNGNDYVFWQGANGGLYEEWHIGSTWYGGPNGDELLASATYEGSYTPYTTPAVAVHANGEQDVFWGKYSGTAEDLMEYSYYNGSWHGPINYGGF